MCGFVGIASTSELEEMGSWTKIANKQIRHRGPDDSGYWVSNDNKVELAHRRLAVVDISHLAAQPMTNEKFGLTIAFNGEIYNHKEIRKELEKIGHSFKSSSDTEVILAAFKEWGKECVKLFNGMFVFALYDSKNQELFIARDRAGEKPLFYYVDHKSISFSSELKGLIRNKKIVREVDKKSLDCFLSFGFVPGKRCIYSGINKLEAGSWLTFNTLSGKLTFKKYWEIPNSVNKFKRENNLLNRFDSLFNESVAKQLEADVPVGVLLSGGLDSSLVTAVASKQKSCIKTFNVRFPGFGKLDETEHARKIADYFDTEHIELDVSNPDPDLLIDLAKQFDEPIIDSSMIPTYMVSKEVRKHCTVALGGDGADELFGGYSHYERLLRLEKFIRFIPNRPLKLISNLILKTLPEDFNGSNWVNSFQFNYSTKSPLVASYFNIDKRRKLLKNLNNSDIGFAEELHNRISPSADDLLGRATRSDFLTYLVEDILVKVDRASMMNSLEIRAPFLDYRIIEFAFSDIPSFLKVDGTHKKIFLQRYARNILPQNFIYGRKQGFSVPLSSWLKEGPFRDFFYDILLAKESIFNKDEIIKTLNANDKGKNNSEKIFGLAMFELWRKTNNASL